MFSNPLSLSLSLVRQESKKALRKAYAGVVVVVDDDGGGGGGGGVGLTIVYFTFRLWLRFLLTFRLLLPHEKGDVNHKKNF